MKNRINQSAITILLSRAFISVTLFLEKRKIFGRRRKKKVHVYTYTRHDRVARDKESRGLTFTKKKKKKGSNELATCRGLEIGRVRARAPRLAFKRILIQSFGRESRQGHRTGSIVC